MYGYPIEEAAKNAVREVEEFLAATAYAIRLRKGYGGQEATAVRENAKDAEMGISPSRRLSAKRMR